MIKFKCFFNTKALKALKKALSLPSVEIGIFKDKPSSDIRFVKKKGLKVVTPMKIFTTNFRGSGNSIKVNVEGKKKEGYTVGNIFYKIILDARFTNDFLGKALNKMPYDIWRRYIVSDKSAAHKKALSNGILSAFLHSYIDYSLALKPKISTIKRKGHDLYMIATGRTFKTITARVKKE